MLTLSFSFYYTKPYTILKHGSTLSPERTHVHVVGHLETLQLASHLALDPWLAATMLQHLVSGTVLNGRFTAQS